MNKRAQMELTKTIDEISILYREKLSFLREQNNILIKLKADLHYRGEDMTVRKFNKLTAQAEKLAKEIHILEQYCRGIFDTRELFLNMVQ